MKNNLASVTNVREERNEGLSGETKLLIRRLCGRKQGVHHTLDGTRVSRKASSGCYDALPLQQVSSRKGAAVRETHMTRYEAPHVGTPMRHSCGPFLWIRMSVSSFVLPWFLPFGIREIVFHEKNKWNTTYKTKHSVGSWRRGGLEPPHQDDDGCAPALPETCPYPKDVCILGKCCSSSGPCPFPLHTHNHVRAVKRTRNGSSLLVSQAHIKEEWKTKRS